MIDGGIAGTPVETRPEYRRLRSAQQKSFSTIDATLSIAIELEGHCYSRLRTSEDFREGVEAFNANLPSKFKGS